MPVLSACAQILWSNLWITRSWLAQPPIWHSLRRVARFLIKVPGQNQSLIKHFALKWCRAGIEIWRGPAGKAVTDVDFQFS
jgi:hypothetical protein